MVYSLVESRELVYLLLIPLEGFMVVLNNLAYLKANSGYVLYDLVGDLGITWPYHVSCDVHLIFKVHTLCLFLKLFFHL